MPITRVELDATQKAKWGDTLTYVTWACPGFIHIFRKLCCTAGDTTVAIFTRDVPVAATDGANIMLNPDTFFKLSLKERLFCIVHEIVHNVYDDINTRKRLIKSGELRYADGTVLPYDESTFQRSMDFRINDMLIESRIGDMPKDIVVDGKEYKLCHDKKIGVAADSVFDIYRKHYDPDNSGGGGFDQVLSPGASAPPGGSAPQRDPTQWQQVMQQAQKMEADHHRGTVSADLQRMFDLFAKPQVPWTEHIRGFFARRLGSGGTDWRRGDRRFIVRDIFVPARSGFGVNHICVWGDTSGSIGVNELNTYFAELAGLVEELNPRKITVYWCDSLIKNVDEVTDSSDLATIKARGVGGGGGTSSIPVFEAIANSNEHEPPDAFVGLTDGEAAFPDMAPSYPCVWAVTTNAEIPFGEVVRIKADVKQ